MSADLRSGAATARDDGSAMILVLLVLTLLTALGATLSAVTLSNLEGSRRAVEAGRVVNAAEAGVAQALTFMKTNGVAGLRCRSDGAQPPTWTGCDTAYGRNQPVTSPAGTPTGSRYSVWVQEVNRFKANSGVQGVYLVHAVGAGGGPSMSSCVTAGGSCRSVTARVVVNDFGFGSGIYSKAIQGNSNGHATVTDESIFTTGCFPKRGSSGTSPFVVTGFDAAHGIPAGVHTTGIITTGPVSKCDDAANSIHAGSGNACNTTFPYDQDSAGGAIKSTSCWTSIQQATQLAIPGGVAKESVFGDAAAGPPADGVWGSKITSQAAMQTEFGLSYPPITDAQLERLRTIAKEDGTYETSPTTFPTSTVAAASRKVLFFDFPATASSFEVKLEDLPAPFNSEQDGACRGALVIIRNGDAVISPSNSGAVVGASVFLLSNVAGRGIATLNGGSLYGGLFAEAMNFSGNPVLRPPSCAAEGNPALLTVSMATYSEDD